ncbi:MAG: hypothetical protein AAGP08_16510, partial [Pseudomonadota bacterium]
MSKSLPLFMTAAGGAALVLGVAFAVASRDYRSDEIAALERKLAVIEDSQQAESAALESAHAVAIEDLTAALASAEDAPPLSSRA